MIGTLALCGWNTLGLITKMEKQKVTYSDGSEALAYVGVHLTDKVSVVGAPWSSKNPKIVGTITYTSLDEVLALFTEACQPVTTLSSISSIT